MSNKNDVSIKATKNENFMSENCIKKFNVPFFKDLVDDNVEDDLITLGELTQYENTVWKFAKTLNCPVRSCASKFSTRNLAIKHYRENHAMHSVLCKICDHPIMLMMGPHHLDTHYHRLHPTVTPPPKVKKIRVNTKTKGLSFSNKFKPFSCYFFIA